MRRRGERDVISIHSRLTKQGKQLVHNFERARSTPGSTSVERMERDGSLLTSAVEYGLFKASLKAEQMPAVESVVSFEGKGYLYQRTDRVWLVWPVRVVIQQPKSLAGRQILCRTG